MKSARRQVLVMAGAAACTIAAPAWTQSRPTLPRMTEGPFYPPLSYRARSLDWDADLTAVRAPAPDGQPRPAAAGEHLELAGAVADTDGRVIDGAEVEIWQCDAHGSYRHPRGAGHRIDDAFQGFGATRTDARGLYRFRTIRPVPYPGRTPHIHIKLRHPSFGEVTSQLFVAGDPGNARDGLYRSLSPAQREAAEMRLVRALGGDRLVWVVERPLWVG